MPSGSPSTYELQNEGTCVLKKMGSGPGGHFLVPHARRALDLLAGNTSGIL